MNPRIRKLSDEIVKLRHKVNDYQARIRDLERQKLELENADIVSAVRSIDVPPEELRAFIEKLQSKPTPQYELEEDVSIEN